MRHFGLARRLARRLVEAWWTFGNPYSVVAPLVMIVLILALLR
jgi:hypothetical protein